MDYEALANSVELPPELAPKTPVPPPAGPTVSAFDRDTVFPAPEGPLDPAEAQASANRVFLPVNHEKYQGIAAAKGYAQGDDFSGNRLKKTRYNHDAMIDVIIAEPTITQNELAKRFDRSVGWISIVMGSDAFQAALAKRREEITDPFLVATVEERLRSLADQSLQVIAENLEKSKNTDLALKALDISAKALGFGARTQTNGATVQNNFVVQLPPKIESSSDWARTHGGPTIDQS